MSNTNTNTISQRCNLPGSFVIEARRQAAELGLSLSDTLGLAARRGWHSTLAALNPDSAPPPMDDVDAARQTRNAERGTGKRGAR
jgi:hypothetical protein